MLKNSFTLFETLISLILIAIISSGFLNVSTFNESNHKNYMLLNNLEKNFDKNDLSKFMKSSKNLKVIINNEDIEFTKVKQYTYTNKDIKLIKYEK